MLTWNWTIDMLIDSEMHLPVHGYASLNIRQMELILLGLNNSGEDTALTAWCHATEKNWLCGSTWCYIRRFQNGCPAQNMFSAPRPEWTCWLEAMLWITVASGTWHHQYPTMKKPHTLTNDIQSRRRSLVCKKNPKTFTCTSARCWHAY